MSDHGNIHIEEKVLKKYQHDHSHFQGVSSNCLPLLSSIVFCDDCGSGFITQLGLTDYHQIAKINDTTLHG